MVYLTREQRVALYNVWKRPISGMPNQMSYREFRKTVLPGMGWVGIHWAGMYLGIEADGYTHS